MLGGFVGMSSCSSKEDSMKAQLSTYFPRRSTGQKQDTQFEGFIFLVGHTEYLMQLPWRSFLLVLFIDKKRYYENLKSNIQLYQTHRLVD